jgi:hypothetical protein
MTSVTFFYCISEIGNQHHVRIEALNSLGKLYSVAYPEMCVIAP